MTIAMLRLVDRVVGAPVCALLTLLGRLRPRPDSKPIRRIAVVKLAEQGSTVLAAAALESAVARVGRENLFFVAFEENRFVLDAMDLVRPENILTIDSRTLLRAARSALAVIRRLRALEIDAVIDFEFFSRSSAILAYLSGAGHRVGLHAYAGAGPYRGGLLTHRLLFNPYLHTSQLFLLMVDALDCDPSRLPAFPVVPVNGSPPDIRCRPTREDFEHVTALLRRQLPMPSGIRRPRCASADDARRESKHAARMPDVPPIILLNANASDLLPLRRWEPARYAELARRLLDARPDACIVLTGGGNEVAAAERLVAQVASERCISVAGQTTMTQLLALFSASRVLVTNDSGPAHFATLTPIEIVTLFGPETPALFAARTPRNHVVWAGLACSPCVSALNNRVSRCRDNRCMQAITVDEVFRATLAAYERAGKGRGTS